MRPIRSRFLTILLALVVLLAGAPTRAATPPPMAPIVSAAPLLQTAPLAESFRLKLLNRFIGSASVWKADDAGETVILAVKDPARSVNDTSLYAVSRAGVLTYLGTTGLGKDGIAGVVVRNDGTVDLFVPEAPAPGDSGSLADLYLVRLQYRLPAAPVPVSGAVDTYARSRLAAIHAATAP